MFEAHLVSFWVKTKQYGQSFWVKKKIISNETFRTNFSNDCPYCLVLTQNDTKCASNIASSYKIRCDLGNNIRTSHRNEGLFWDTWYFIQKRTVHFVRICKYALSTNRWSRKNPRRNNPGFFRDHRFVLRVYFEIFGILFKKGPFTMCGFVNTPSVRIDGRGKILDHFV